MSEKLTLSRSKIEERKQRAEATVKLHTPLLETIQFGSDAIIQVALAEEEIAVCNMALAWLEVQPIPAWDVIVSHAAQLHRDSSGEFVFMSKKKPIAAQFRIYRGAYEALREALSTLPSTHVVVPREPTREMCEAPEAMPPIHAVDDLPLSKAGWSPKAIQNLNRFRAMIAEVK